MLEQILAYQRAWIEDRAPIKIFEKSRRIGISWASALEAAWTASRGQNVYYCGYNLHMCRQFISDVTYWCEQLGVQTRRPKVLSVDFDAAEVCALPSTAQNLRGKKGSVIIDEAAFHPDLQSMLKAAGALRIWGGKLSVISTHFGVGNSFFSLINDARAGVIDASLHRCTIDEALHHGLFARICEQTGESCTQASMKKWRDDIFRDYGAFADEELLCIPSRSGGLYIPQELIERCMLVDAPTHTLDAQSLEHLTDAQMHTYATTYARTHATHGDGAHVIGVDIGRVSDLTSVCVMRITQSMKREVVAIHEWHNVPFELQKRMVFELARVTPRMCKLHVDATGIGAHIGEEAERMFGSAGKAVKITDKWYCDTLPPLRAAMERGHVSLPRSETILTDMMQFRIVDGLPKLAKSRTSREDLGAGRIKTRHGDSAISIALAYSASRSLGEPSAIQPSATTPRSAARHPTEARRNSERKSSGWL